MTQLTSWHSWETLIMTLRVRDWQSESDLDSIFNSCDVYSLSYLRWAVLVAAALVSCLQASGGSVTFFLQEILPPVRWERWDGFENAEETQKEEGHPTSPPHHHKWPAISQDHPMRWFATDISWQIFKAWSEATEATSYEEKKISLRPLHPKSSWSPQWKTEVWQQFVEHWIVRP